MNRIRNRIRIRLWHARMRARRGSCGVSSRVQREHPWIELWQLRCLQRGERLDQRNRQSEVPFRHFLLDFIEQRLRHICRSHHEERRQHSRLQLVVDATLLTIWGDGSAGTGTFKGTGTGTEVATPVYGRIPARQNAHVGTYSDMVTVTVTF